MGPELPEGEAAEPLAAGHCGQARGAADRARVAAGLLSPSVAFAAAALATATLALAFSLGRQWPVGTAAPRAADGLEAARLLPAVSYEALAVDRGAQDLPVAAAEREVR